MFGGKRVPEDLSCLAAVRSYKQVPWPIILTTSQHALGQDFTRIAYVIQTELPPAWAIFLQNAGRANRLDPSAVLTGAVVTSACVFDVDSIKLGCEYEQEQ